MKRIVSLLLCMILVFSAASVFAAETSTSSDGELDLALLSKAEVLSAIGVFDEGNIDYSKKVTRLEFAEFLVGLLGVKDKSIAQKDYFNDTSERYVNNLVSLKIVSGCSNGKFEPDRIITSGEAVTMVMRALGYRDLVEKRGGSAFEYSREAMKTGLDFNDNLNVELEISDVIELLFDALGQTVFDIKTITFANENTYATYTYETEITVIELYRGLTLINGQVTANFLTTIGETDVVEKDQLAIDSCIYNCYQNDAFSYIGQRVFAIYNNQFDYIQFITPDFDRMSVFELDASEILSYNDFSLTYQSKNAKKEKSINFERRTLKVIYNGKAIDTDFKSAFEIGMGTVKLYSNGKSDKYVVAVIEEYMDVTVKSASTETLRIYTDGYGDANVLDFSDVDGQRGYKKLFSAESGLPIGLKSVAENDLLSVCISRDKTYNVGYVCAQKVIGEVKTIWSDNGTKYVEINGTQYPLSPYYNGPEIKTGRTGKFIINKFGFIGRTEEINQTSSEIAYVYYIAEVPEPFSTDIKMQLYTETKEHLVYSMADNVVFNGDRIPKTTAYLNLTPNGQLSKGLIKYTVNSKGKISAIDTGGGDMLFSELTSGAQALKYVDQNRAFGKNGEYVMTKGTKVFMVPRNGERIIPENFNIVNYRESMTPAFTTEETVRIYQDNDDPFVEYVVCFYDNRKTTVYGSGSIHMMVEEVVTEATDDGGSITVIKGYSNCMPFEIAVTDDVQVLAYAGEELKGIDVVEPGDWIVGTTNVNGILSYILLMYNADADVFNPSKPGVHAFFDSQGKLSNANYYDGDVLKVERGGKAGSEVLIVLGKKETGEIRNCIVLDEKLMKFMLYYATKRNGEWSVGNVDDIISLEMTNGEKCDRVYFEFRSNSRFTNMAVYRH